MPDEQGGPESGKKRNSERVNAKEFRRKEKHSDSGLRLIVFLIVGGIIGGVVSYYAINLVFEGTLSSLEADKSSYEEEYAAVSEDYRTLYEDYSTLVQDKKSLEGLVNSLQAEKDALQENIMELSQQLALTTGNNTGLSLEIGLLKGYLLDINGVLSQLNSSLNGYSRIPEAYIRVINTETLDEIGDTVDSVTSTSSTHMEAYRNIYDYITSTVDYVYDVELPYIGAYHYVDIYDFDIITEASFSTIRNYVQTPGFTVEYSQGDCDDQAVLAYAMMGYYHRLQPTDSTIYLASISFDDDSGHLAVFISNSEGLLILDPAGHHFTQKWGSVDSFRDPQDELESYDTKWNAYGGIVEIKMHSVSYITGAVLQSFSGDLAAVTSYLS